MASKAEHATNGRPVESATNELRIPYTNMRDWIEEAEKLGEVKYVESATWERDIGMASEVVQHDENAPCVIFEQIPRSLEGSRLLVNFFAGKRMNMTLGFPTDLSKLELTDAFRTTCLLYTSPSPRDRTRSRMPSSA